jgi:DNA-binding transcriptional ArsR family regulator
MVEARLFQALSDATRLKILALLAREPMNVSRMVKELGYAQPAVSRHLRVLREVDLIHDTRRGKEVQYSLNHGQVGNAAAYLEQLVGVSPSEARSGGRRKVVGRSRGKKAAGDRAPIRRGKTPPGQAQHEDVGRVERRDEPEYAIERKDDTMDDFML